MKQKQAKAELCAPDEVKSSAADDLVGMTTLAWRNVVFLGEQLGWLVGRLRAEDPSVNLPRQNTKCCDVLSTVDGQLIVAMQTLEELLEASQSTVRHNG